MRAARLARFALEAERSRLALLVRRQVRTAGLWAAAGLFGVAAFATAHLLAWHLLSAQAEAARAAILLGADLVLLLIAALAASLQRPSRWEWEAERVRDRALQAAGESLRPAALVREVGLLRAASVFLSLYRMMRRRR